MESEDSSSLTIVNKCLDTNKFTSGDTTSRISVIKYLEKKNFTSVKSLDSGGFGDVLSAVSPKKEEVAIKIVKNALSWNMEELIWPVLDHPNVLPLHYVLDLKELNIKMYIMPKHPTSMDKIIQGSEFTADSNGLNRMRRWLQNIAEALKYLHRKGFVHLDVKSDNVLISMEDTAILCDFSGINLKKIPCTRLVAPRVYRPPECFRLSEKIDGVAFDIWTYGLMSLYALTKNWPICYLDAVYDYDSWKTNIETVLNDSLKPANFIKNMRSSLPAVTMTNKDICTIRDFVLTMLQWDPNKRPTADEILEHPFFLVKTHQHKVLDNHEYDKKEMKIRNPLVDGLLSKTEDNPEKFGVSSKPVRPDSVLSISEDNKICGSKGCRFEKSKKSNCCKDVCANQCSVEKEELDIAPVQKISSKKKNISKRIKGWATKQINRALKSIRKKRNMFIDNMVEEHWTNHWTILQVY